MKPIGRTIRAARRAAGLSLYALGKATGIKSSQIGEYETGQHEPSWSRAVDVLDAVGMEVKIQLKTGKEK